MADHLKYGKIHSCGCSYSSYPYRDLFEYPQNVMLDINIIPSVNRDEYAKQQEGFEKAYELLSNKEQCILLDYYKYFRSLSQISDKYKVSVERIRQIKNRVLEKLQHPTINRMICYGISEVKTYETETDNSILLENAGFSSRTYNALKRYGFNDLSEIAIYGKDRLLNIKNMGKSTITEIIKVLEKNGFSLDKRNIVL